MMLARISLFTILAIVASCASVPPASAGPSRGKYFDRVIYVVFENTNYEAAAKQPFFTKLAKEGMSFTRFSAETHPSQGNYVAMAAGALHGIKDDRKLDLNVSHIADLLEAGGRSWKVYAEGYPGNCFLGATKGAYARKHVPFVSFVNIQKKPARCANIVNASEFDRDVAAGTLPDYVFYVPDLKNDGHDTGPVFADMWYQKKFEPLLGNAKVMENTLLITTFDENAGEKGNYIYTSFYGPMVRNGTSDASLNHYSLLRLVEDNWSLGSLHLEDAKATLVPDVWR